MTEAQPQVHSGTSRAHGTRLVAADIVPPLGAANSTPPNPLVGFEGSLRGEGERERREGKRKGDKVRKG